MTTLLKNIFNNKNLVPEKLSFRFDDINAARKSSEQLISYLKLLNPTFSRPLVVVAIGTDRSTGDSLGPLVGSLLEEKRALIPNLIVYGTLDNPVHAANLKNKMESIFNEYPNPVIIAVDACLGQSKNVGNLNIGLGPIKPGAAVKKELPAVGHIHITGTVNVGGYLEYLVLQNTRLSLVMKLSKLIAETIYKTYRQIEREKIKMPSH